MRSQRPDTTPEDLRNLLIDIHRRAGWTPRELGALIYAHEKHGLLRPDCPGWMQQSAFFVLSKSAPVPGELLDSYADRITESILLRVP
jgi:hypothetical protein